MMGDHQVRIYENLKLKCLGLLDKIHHANRPNYIERLVFNQY